MNRKPYAPPGYRGSSSQQAASAACFDGWMVDGGWWMDGQRKSKKIMYFKNFSNTIQYFLLVVSRPLRRVFKTFSWKSSKKNKIFMIFFKFRTIFFQRFFRFFSPFFCFPPLFLHPHFLPPIF